MLSPGFLAFGQINLLAAETKHAYLRSKYTGDYEEAGGLFQDLPLILMLLSWRLLQHLSPAIARNVDSRTRLDEHQHDFARPQEYKASFGFSLFTSDSVRAAVFSPQSLGPTPQDAISRDAGARNESRSAAIAG